MTQTILVIEDEFPTRAFILKVLKSAGYSVYGASRGEEGLQLAKTIQPDLILCDIVLPKLNGYAVLDTLRQGMKTAAIPLIFLTSKADKSDQRAGIELGADDYLTKPFSPEGLLASVRARLTSFDRFQLPQDEVPQFLGKPSGLWIYKHIIGPNLQQNYSGWFIALEPQSGQCFLGATREAAFRAARLAFPDGIFFFHELEPKSESRMLEACA